MGRRSQNRDHEIFREQVLAKVRQGYWGTDLGRLFPDIPRTTMISWAKRYLKPEEIPTEDTRIRFDKDIKVRPKALRKRDPLKPNVKVKVSTNARLEGTEPVETTVDDASTYFNYRVNYDEAMADIDRTRGWVQGVLIQLISDAQTPLTRIRAIDTLNKVLSDRERHIRAERAIIESIHATHDDAAALWEYLQKNEGVSLEVSYE